MAASQSLIDSISKQVAAIAKSVASVTAAVQKTTSGGSSSSSSSSNIINYDPNTGRKLNKGESVVDKATGKTFTQGQPLSTTTGNAGTATNSQSSYQGKSGDTLKSVAKQYGISATELSALNPNMSFSGGGSASVNGKSLIVPKSNASSAPATPVPVAATPTPVAVTPATPTPTPASASTTSTPAASTASNIVNFDPNTGRKLNPGESVVDKATGKTVTQGTPLAGTTILAAPAAPASPTTPAAPTDSNIVNFNPNTGAQLSPGESVVNAQTGQTVTQGTPLAGTTTPAAPITPVAPVVQTEATTAMLAAGISQATINAMSPDQQNMFAAVAAVIQTQYDQNKVVPPTFTTDDLSRIMSEAQNDPTISDYYKGLLTQGKDEFQQLYSMTAKEASTQDKANQLKFTADKKALVENTAAAGQAYSGFRGQAEKKLGEEQSGIIESSRQAIQRNVTAMGSAFEKQYGSAELAKLYLAPIDGATYTPIGGITGQQAQDKTIDTRGRYDELLQQEALTRGITT